MARSVKPWVGKSDDTAVPQRVRVRVFLKFEKRCSAGCGRAILPGEAWTCEHVIALINWTPTDDAPHGNRESNLGVTCCNCLKPKNAADQAEKSKTYDWRRKTLLPKKEKDGFTGFRKLPPHLKKDFRTGRISER